MIRLYFIIISSILFAQGVLASTNYYVADSTNANPTAAWGGIPSDANAGTSWATAWASIAKVNSTVTSGDTVQFSTGIWHDKLITKAGTYAARTTYACSSFVEVNAAGEYHFAQIWGSKRITGWTLHSGNIYKAYITSPEDSLLKAGKVPNLWDASATPANQWMQRRTTLGGIGAAGEWYWNGRDSLYTWVIGNDDPDNHDMEMTRFKSPVQTFDYTDWVGHDYVTIYGFHLKYGDQTLVDGNYIMMETAPYDSVFIDHCHLSHVSEWNGINPALIYSGWSGSTAYDGAGHFNRVRACSLGYAYGVSNTSYSPSSNKGSGIDHYNQANYLIDSNSFYGYFKQGAIYWKAAYPASSWSENDVIAYNTFTNTNGYGIEFFGACRNNEVYGNIFKGVSRGIKTRRSRVANDGISKYYNNTFIDCPNPLLMSSSSGDGSNYQIDNEFKYNVIFSTTNQTMSINSFGGPGSEFIDVNSNLYFNSGGSLRLEYPTGTSVSQSYWRNTVGMDQQSTFTVSPQFTDAAYARDSASMEMDTTYGGQRWTVFGAVQGPAGPPCPKQPAPNLVGPCGVTGVSQPVTVIWSLVGGAVSYQVQWDVSQQFGGSAQTSPVIYSPTTSYTLPNLSNGVQYYWRVRSSDSCGWGNWSATPCDFTTACLPLGSGSLIAPSDGVAGLSQPFLLEWQSVSSANWYHLQVDNDLSFASPIIDARPTDTTYPVLGLADTSSYYWRVRSGNICDSSSWSSPWSFKVIPDSSSPVGLVGSWSTGLTHTPGYGNNRLLVFIVNWEGLSANGDKPITSITYGGQTMTRAVRVVAGQYNGTEIWYLDEFGITSAIGNSFNVNWTNGAPAFIYYSAATYENVHPTIPVIDTASNFTDNGSISPLTATVTTVSNGMSVAGSSHGNDGTFTWGNGWVKQTEQNGLGMTGSTADHPESTTGSSTASVVHSTSNKRYVIAVISLAPAVLSSNQDTIPPAKINDLGALPGSVDGSALVIRAAENRDRLLESFAAVVIPETDMLVGHQSSLNQLKGKNPWSN